MSGRILNREPEVCLPLPEIGRVRIGMKNEKGYPMSVDHFIPTGKYASFFTAEYGDKPQTIQIIFIDDNPVLSCDEKYEYRDDAGRSFAWGDGETFQVWSKTTQKYKTVSISEMPDVMDFVKKQSPAKKGWEISLILRFIIPKIRGIAGYWQFSTKGDASTIPQVRNIFDTMLERRGSVQGMIFDLNVKFAKSNKPGITSKYPVVSLVPNHSEENIAMIKGGIMDFQNTKLLTQ